MRHRKSLIQAREKSQEVGYFRSIVLICMEQVIGAAQKLRESHAKPRNKNKEVATVSS